MECRSRRKNGLILLVNSCIVLLSLNLLVLKPSSLVVLCLDSKYFKRFYFGNLSVDLTEELGERFNYDYLPPSSSSSSSSSSTRGGSTSNSGLNNALPFHIHMKQSPSHYYHTGDHTLFHEGHNSPAASSSLSSPQHQADQPVHNSTNNNNNDSAPPPTTPPPPPSNNQPYRHQDLKALSRNITNILNSFNISYDKRVRPNYGSEAVEVGITMFVLSISALSEVEMDFTVDFYFRQMWKDQRLTFQGPKGVNTLSVSSEFLKSMWVPDTFFVNEKTSYFHTATTNNEFLRISQTGDILRSMRLTVCASCPMDLRYFPMDSQLCNVEIESFGYTMSDIRYKWAAGAGSVGMATDVSLPQFKVLGYRQKAYEISLSTGNYSRLACEIQFVRSMGYYLIQIYIPSSLIVVISWVSFWLNRNAAPARVYLGITTVLTMTTLMSSTNKALPKISYVKSIDVYLGTCFVMVFAALLEYATVGYLAKRIQMRKNHFAALQKMALQLQTAREEHIQKQYFPPTPVLPQPLPQPLPPPQQQPQQQPTTPHQAPHQHHHQQQHSHIHHQSSSAGGTTTPRYNPSDHYHQQVTSSSSTRFLDSSSNPNTLRKYTNTNNAQFISSQQQQQQQSSTLPHGIMGSTTSMGIPASGAANIPPGYYNRGIYDRSSGPPVPPDQQQRYYDAQIYEQRGGGVGGSSSNAVVNNPHHQMYYQQQQQQPQQPQYYRESTGWGDGTTSRGASVKRRGGSAAGGVLESDLGIEQQRYMVQQQQQQQPQQQVIGIQNTQIQQQQQQQQFVQQQQVSQIEQQSGGNNNSPGSGDKIRQLIPINPNQICGITPSDIDKYSRVVFPLCFVCFNLLYWIIYLHISHVNPTTDLVIVNAEG